MGFDIIGFFAYGQEATTFCPFLYFKEDSVMNELLKINYDSERPTVSGRDLHMALKIGSRYNDWFNRMCEYGFFEDTDYETRYSNLSSK